jgi:hypothetical protein
MITLSSVENVLATGRVLYMKVPSVKCIRALIPAYRIETFSRNLEPFAAVSACPIPIASCSLTRTFNARPAKELEIFAFLF